ncbi:MAG: hypothetical protein P1V35_12040, partial [Planctomycetota bacterium]|nr:hypothetical protein [Planctomycetota bacterium]
ESVEFLTVQLGDAPSVVRETVRVGSFWMGQKGIAGLTMHNLLFWEGREGGVRGLFGGQGHFGLSVAGTLAPGETNWEMPATFHESANPLQFLGTYAVVFAGPTSDSILAPNLFFGTIMQAPSTSPLTALTIGRNGRSISMRAIEADQVVSKTLRLVNAK